MSRPLISVVVMTAREDRPWLNRPDLRTCDPAVLTLAQQEGAPPFEILVSDANLPHRTEVPWDQMGLASTLTRIQHLNGENEWHRLGRPGFCRQVNEAARVAEGEILVVLAECCLCPPHLLRAIAREHEAGRWPNLLYMQDSTDNTFTAGAPFSGTAATASLALPPYNLLGYRGEHVVAEHRWDVLGDRDFLTLDQSPAWWGHCFGYVTIPRQVFLSIGGYDEIMDGDSQCQDTDLGSRLEMQGDAGKLALVRDCWVVEAVPASARWNSRFEQGVVVKCNYALLKWNREQRRIDVQVPMNQDETAITWRVCGARETRHNGLPTIAPLCEVVAECRAKNEFWPLLTKRPEAAAQLAHWRKMPQGVSARVGQ